jgi:ketosteroid isomerase-like protein
VTGRGPAEVFQRWVAAGMRRDADAQAEMFTVDGVLEWPLAPVGGPSPRRVEGRESIRRFLADVHGRPVPPRPVDVARSRYVLHLTADPEVFVAEIDVAFLDRGVDEAMSLVHVYRLREGQIASLRDYFEPDRLD